MEHPGAFACTASVCGRHAVGTQQPLVCGQRLNFLRVESALGFALECLALYFGLLGWLWDRADALVALTPFAGSEVVVGCMFVVLVSWTSALQSRAGPPLKTPPPKTPPHPDQLCYALRKKKRKVWGRRGIIL